jgi:hypothetical protein
LLHEVGDGARLRDVVRVRHEGCGFGGESRATSFASSSLGYRLPRSLGTRHAPPAGQLIEGARSLVAEPE